MNELHWALLSFYAIGYPFGVWWLVRQYRKDFKRLDVLGVVLILAVSWAYPGVVPVMWWMDQECEG